MKVQRRLTKMAEVLLGYSYIVTQEKYFDSQYWIQDF